MRCRGDQTRPDSEESPRNISKRPVGALEPTIRTKSQDLSRSIDVSGVLFEAKGEMSQGSGIEQSIMMDADDVAIVLQKGEGDYRFMTTGGNAVRQQVWRGNLQA